MWRWSRQLKYLNLCWQKTSSQDRDPPWSEEGMGGAGSFEIGL